VVSVIALDVSFSAALRQACIWADVCTFNLHLLGISIDLAVLFHYSKFTLALCSVQTMQMFEIV
jgi:hypothetical protein